MGPRILSRISPKTNIRYSLRLLPIGGFVNMVGEDEEADPNDTGALNKKPVWQRIIINVSGAVMNLALGVLVMAVVVITSENLGSTTIYMFEEDSISFSTGLMVDDKIVKINKASTHIANDLIYEIMRKGVEPVDVTVVRNGEKIVLRSVEFSTIVSQGIEYGSVDFYVYGVQKTPLNIIKHAYFQSVSSMKMIWESIYDVVTGKYGIKQMSGPVGVTTAIGEAASTGRTNLLYLCSIISLNLGIFNLLPLPALDGGRIVFQVIEIIRGKPIKPEYEGYVHFVGIVLLMVLMVVVTYQDILKLFTGG